MASDVESTKAPMAAPSTSVPRRVFTAPELRPSQTQTSAQSSVGLVETLFSHPAVKIVAFNAGPRSLSLSPGRGPVMPELEPGSLDAFSQLERTIAVGPFQIYRAPGSVAFLSCSSALQPILPKSQCWAIDELSTKYVLQIRRPQYWRIELLTAEANDAQGSIQRLREVFDQILQFEKTPCPFRRTFSVVLPERPATPVKKRPWTPARRRSPTLPPTPMTPVEMHARKLSLPARDIVLDSLHRLPPEHRPRKKTPQKVKANPPPSDTLTEPFGEAPIANDAAHVLTGPEILKEDESAGDMIFPEAFSHSPPIPPRLAKFRSSRSATLPPHLTLVTSPPSKSAVSQPTTMSMQSTEAMQAIEPTDRKLQMEAEDASRRSSATESSDSFHTVPSWHSPITPLPPSPPPSDPASPENYPYPHDNIQYPKQSAHHRDKSENTVMADTKVTLGPLSASDAEETIPSATTSMSAGPPTPDFELAPEEKDPDEEDTIKLTGIETTSATAVRRPAYRHRATTSSISVRQRALSPLPPAVNLITPQRPREARPKLPPRPRTDPSRLALVRRLPLTVIHKTCEILLSPPSHLIGLMLRVAARIAAGEWRGFVSGQGDRGEEMAVSWDYSSEEGSRRSSEDWDVVEQEVVDHDREEHEVREERIANTNLEEGFIKTKAELKAVLTKDATEEDADWSKSWGVD